MLYFSKTKIFIIYSVIFFLSLCAFLNLIENDQNFILSKKVNLGLDLQGGSYMLLEVDSEPVLKQKLQEKLLNFKKYLKKNKIQYQDLKITNQSINFNPQFVCLQMTALKTILNSKMHTARINLA